MAVVNIALLEYDLLASHELKTRLIVEIYLLSEHMPKIPSLELKIIEAAYVIN